MNELPPTLQQIHDAAARISPYAIVTPVLRSDALDALVGAQLHFKCEHLQRGGAFKFRGACNAVWALSEEDASRGVVTHSSGNHGNALALAAATRGIVAHVVVPDGAVRAKVEAIERAGAVLHRCAATQAAREAKAEAVRRETGASLVHPYADTNVMAGQGTWVLELLHQVEGIDTLITPIGGGGLAAGSAIAAHAFRPQLQLFGAEPAGAADASRSLAQGARIESFSPVTVCDGLRALIGKPNFEVLQQHRVDVIEVSDEETIAAMQYLWRELKQIVEVSSATVLAALLKQPERFAGKRVGIVLTGGNVDIESLPW